MDLRVILAALVGGLVTTAALYAVARRGWRRDTGESLAVLARRYRSWEAAGVGLMLLAVLLCWGLLIALTRFYPPAQPEFVHRLTPHPFYWLALAFFLGNLVATGPTHLLYSWLLGERFAELRAYQTRKFGFDSGRWMLPFYLVFAPITGFLVALLLDWYVLIGAEGMVIDDIFSWDAAHYSYEDVMEIRAAERIEQRDGHMSEGWSFMVYFIDGSRWSSRSDPSGIDSARAQSLARYISEHSDLPVIEVGALQEVEY